MKNFNWNSFTKRIALQSTLSQIYDAWSIPSELEKWFLKKADFYDEHNNLINSNVNVNKNNKYNWSWYLYDDIENGIITDTNGKDYLQFTFAGECVVDINLKNHKNHIIIELTQKNIPSDDKSKQYIRLGCDSGWSFYLVNLKSVYEGGLDLRNKNSDFDDMINN